ncbi:MAG TPA: hypothetical protein PKN32_04355 [Bacteroidales bacterium]|nr:hypothetical protein [Bacteroidales bacterium]
MIINNKLDNTFGTVGTVLGVVILLSGIYVCFYSWIGFTTIIVGIFLAFSNTSTKLDVENKRLKYSSNMFGFISVGYWISVKPEMNLFLKDCTKKNNFSLTGNKSPSPLTNDFRIFLTDESGRELLAVKKFNDKLLAENEMIDLKQKLGLKNQ